MDYNDVKKRLELTLDSMESRFDDSYIESKIKIENVISLHYSTQTVRIGDLSENQIINQVMVILSNLSAIKDPLKKKLGSNARVVEEAINSSPHLQWVLDIVNLYKHGEPLRVRRSNCHPRIVDLQQMLNLSTSGEPGSVASFSLGMDGKVSIQGAAVIKIYGRVTDETGRHLCSLDDLVERSYIEFDQLVDKYL